MPSINQFLMTGFYIDREKLVKNDKTYYKMKFYQSVRNEKVEDMRFTIWTDQDIKPIVNAHYDLTGEIREINGEIKLRLTSYCYCKHCSGGSHE